MVSLRPARSEAATRALSIEVDGATLNAECRGAHPALVFVHGFGGDLHDWDRLWASTDRDALRYDLRGFGQSRQDETVTFDHVDDLLALLDAAGIAQADLVGMSMGGAVALGFALSHPERVRRLVLISPGLRGWEWTGEWRSLWRAIATAARGGDMGQARELWWQHPFFRTARTCPAAAELHASIQRYSGAQWIRDPQRMTLPDLDRLPTLRVPTLLLTGAEDVADFRLPADLIAGSAPGVERVDLPGIGHMVPLEAPEETAAQVHRFLG